MPNTSGEDRRGVIMGWRSSQASTGVGCGLPADMLERLEAGGRLRRPDTRRVMRRVLNGARVSVFPLYLAQF